MANIKRTRRPVHPGRILKEDILDELDINVTSAAKMLGVSRKHLSNFINEQVDCSPDLASRLAHATDTTVASWMNMQNALNIWREENSEKTYEDIQPFSFSKTA